MDVGLNDHIPKPWPAMPTHASPAVLLGWVNPAPNAAPASAPNVTAVRLSGGKVYFCYGAYADVGHSDDCPARKG